jgi:hypothetical protein
VCNGPSGPGRRGRRAVDNSLAKLPLPVYRPYTSDISASRRTLAPNSWGVNAWPEGEGADTFLPPDTLWGRVENPSSTSSPTPVTPSEPDGGFYRDPLRVAILTFLAPVAYEWWWFWQLFRFTRRERFHRARAFWWIFVPVYGWVVIYRQFDDLKQQLPAESRPRFSASLGVVLVILSQSLGSGSGTTTGLADFAVVVISGVLIALATFIVQRAANVYQEARYPVIRSAGMTRGEAIATIIGVVAFILLGLAAFLPS